MNIKTALESANSFTAIHKIADRVQPHCSFFGTEYLSSAKYEGTLSMDDLVCRVIKLTRKTPEHEYGEDEGRLRLSYSECIKAKALVGRIDHLYSERSSDYLFFSTFFTLIRFLPEKIYNVVWLGKEIINFYPPYWHWTERCHDKLSNATP